MKVECECINHKWSNGLKYTCRESEILKVEPETRIATFKGIHLAGKTNIDVEALLISSTQVEYFPKGLPTTFPSLTNVEIDNCGLKEISRKDFEGLGNLKYLSLSYNELKALPNDLFVETPKLRWIYINCNKIERLSSKIFDPLDKTSLEVFWLNRSNSSINMNFEQGGATTLEAFMKEIDAKFLPPIEGSSPHEPTNPPQNRFNNYFLGKNF